MKSRLLGAMCPCILLLIATTTNATRLPLEGRLPSTPGGTDYQAYYDPNLDLTWLADANAGAGSPYDLEGTGRMTWDNATAWTASLDIGGVSGWRLPSVDRDGDGSIEAAKVRGEPAIPTGFDCFGGPTDCEDNEMFFMFFGRGISRDTPGPFINIQLVDYWSNVERNGGTVDTSEFGCCGTIDNFDKSTFNQAWAVRDGDVVPIPSALWLFGSGLLGLVGIARHKKAA